MFRAKLFVIILSLTAWCLCAGTCGFASPSIRIQQLPAMGDCGNATGTAWGIDPAQHMAAVLIYIPGSGWWSKPTCDARATPINSDGTWSTSVCTGGLDNTAAMVEVYLIPKASYPQCYPACVLGAGCVPGSLKDAAIASDRMLRPGLRRLRWSGHDWIVKTGPLPVGPGPNYFSSSAENVWVDEQDRLHLRITSRTGKWYCAEIYSEHRMGYGTYRFYLDGRVDDLDPNIVLGLFSWSDHTCDFAHREIDIEFSRWGDASGPNTQFVVQPWYIPGNRERFTIPDTPQSTHTIFWSPNEVRFASLEGHCPNPNFCPVVKAWTFSNESAIPPSGDERVHLNLWLRDGLPPTSGQEREVVISRFEFEPLKNAGDPVRGISNRDISRPPASLAGGRFRVWGRIVASDCVSMLLDDGSALPVRVLELGHTLETNDYAVADGLLAPGGMPTAIDASAGRVWKINTD